MTAPQQPVATGFVDPNLMKQVLAKAARTYGQALGGAGLLNGVMASSWAWAPRGAAIAITVVGLLAILAGLLAFGRKNVSTLRELVSTSRLFLGGSVGAWVVGALIAIVAKSAVVWWVLAVVLLALGAYCAWRAYQKAAELDQPVETKGAVY